MMDCRFKRIIVFLFIQQLYPFLSGPSIDVTSHGQNLYRHYYFIILIDDDDSVSIPHCLGVQSCNSYPVTLSTSFPM